MQLVRTTLACAAMLFISTRFSVAQEPAGNDHEARTAPAQPEGANPLGLKPGPCTGELGSIARVRVPEGLAFVDRQGTRKWLEMNQNVPNGRELGAVISPKSWFVIFEYRDTGHVKDEDKDKLDADALLAALKEGTEASNNERKKRGWDTLELVGWQKPPFYDSKTHNLTWSTLGRSKHGESVNWSTRLLGRTGTMHVDLVANPQEIDEVLPQFDALMDGFEYVEGKRYAEFRPGEKMAEYGLAALVAGGAGVVAAKTGLIAKFWKLIVLAVGAVGAFFKRLFGFGKKTKTGDGAA